MPHSMSRRNLFLARAKWDLAVMNSPLRSRRIRCVAGAPRVFPRGPQLLAATPSSLICMAGALWWFPFNFRRCLNQRPPVSGRGYRLDLRLLRQK